MKLHWTASVKSRSGSLIPSGGGRYIGCVIIRSNRIPLQLSRSLNRLLVEGRADKVANATDDTLLDVR